jgi:two-component system sensor histidine kinase KdpD
VLVSTQHLARLVNRLLDLSALERGALLLEIERVDVRTVVEIALDAEPAPAEHVVTSDVPAGIVAMADELSLEQILTNLLRNAYRYGGPHIEIGARRDGDRVLLTVTDDGEGVDPTIESNLFHPFVRGPGRRDDGAGLGLAVSRRLAEAMGGELRYERPRSGVSRFVVDLTAAPDPP